jgi:exodeoxyribonuclease VII large subunit
LSRNAKCYNTVMFEEFELQTGLAEEKPLTVSEFISNANASLHALAARIVGEIGRVDEKNGHRYFALKDEANGNTLNCIVWRSKYEMFGLDLKEGDKIIVAGRPEIYPASGKLSFICDSIELAGAGALKKAYDALKKKLKDEGLFAPERKRKLPQYPRVIGIITSKQGAVINDFLTNIGKFGFRLELIDTRVEGQLAVGDILAAIRTFKDRKIDVLVVIRGGGSPESLQAFNNETIVREVAAFPVPVIAGIGHDKDVPLVQMAADVSVSTPSIAATQLNASWQKILQFIAQQEISIIGRYANELARRRAQLAGYAGILSNFRHILRNLIAALDEKARKMTMELGQALDAAGKQIVYFQNLMASHDPERPLKLGYSIAILNGKVLRKIAQAAAGDKVDIKVSDGKILSEVKEITKT